MSTAPSTVKGKTGAKAAVASVGAAPSGGGRVTAKSFRSLARRPPIVVLGILGTVIGGGYGRFILGMRFGPPLVMVALGGLTLALCAAALWRVIDPLTRAETALVTEARAPHRIRELEREKQAVLKAIKEIELDYQMRKISEGDYREMVERYRARALRIMGDLAAGDDYRALIERELKDRLAATRAAAALRFDQTTAGESEPDAEAADEAPGGASSDSARSRSPLNDQLVPPVSASGARTICPRCSAINDADARFCKKCGEGMPPLPSVASV